MPGTHIVGFPYFPGTATGRLHRGTSVSGDTALCIVMLSQHEIISFKGHAAGLIIVEAAPFSHSMIGLLGFGLPTVLISTKQAEQLGAGIELVIDGSSGVITDTLDAISPAVDNNSLLQPGQALLMADGEPVDLCASIRQADSARQAFVLGARSIGLVRSEFLSTEHDQIPDTEFYQHSFRQLCEAASGLSVTLRLLDVAADKIPLWLPPLDSIGQPLGQQGVRLYHSEPVRSIVDAQLSAVSILSTEFKLRVLIPYITRLEEYIYWLSQIRQRLPDNVAVGAMAETPASVLDVGHLLEDADFVAIGCNDLMQSLYAADRDLAAQRHYLDPYAPVLYRLFRHVAEQAGIQLARIQLCGLLPQIQGCLPVLLGLGYRTFSVDAPFIPYLVQIIANTTQQKCEKLAQQVCAARTTQQVLQILQLPTDMH
jgi:phosphoenolpyruvate-protein kinase (PTS system EI component)